MKDVSKDVLARVEELSKRISALESELALLKKEKDSIDDEDALSDDDSTPVEMDAIDLDLDGISDDVFPESASEPIPVPEIVEEIDLPAPDLSAESEVIETDLPSISMEPEEGDDKEVPQEGFGLFGELEPVATTRQKVGKQKKAVMDLMSSKEAWRSDMPGSPVKNIRSAISLNDRVMFISSLFRRDSVLFQDTLERLNAMDSLAEAVKYLKCTFPEWAWGSETTYRFMMCVRRKLR